MVKTMIYITHTINNYVMLIYVSMVRQVTARKKSSHIFNKYILLKTVFVGRNFVWVRYSINAKNYRTCSGGPSPRRSPPNRAHGLKYKSKNLKLASVRSQ